MSKFCLLLIAVTLLTFTSCRKDQFDHLELQIEGTWKFVDANQRTHDAFAGHQSIFNDYQDDQIQFTSDKKVIYTEANGTQLDGIWDIRDVITTDSEGDTQSEYIISIALTDGSGNLKQYIWEVQDINIGYFLRVEERTVDQIFCYELQKL